MVFSQFNTATSSLLLGVNIDHVATLRNQRHCQYPDPVQAAILAEQYGADLITVHLREDRRHIRDGDLVAIAKVIQTRLNLECALTDEMVDIALQVQPHDVCLVPERREELTTEGGLDARTNAERIAQVQSKFRERGIRCGLFIDPDIQQIQVAKDIGVSVIEIHTGRYAESKGLEQVNELQRIRVAAQWAFSHGIEVHAGHGLTLSNVGEIAKIPEISELNIGHAIVAESIFVGWETAIRQMKAAMQLARSQH